LNMPILNPNLYCFAARSLRNLSQEVSKITKPG
jgi:hypothetical protein